MIFIMSEKTFSKNKKKLVEPKDYVIMDATDDDSGDMSKFRHTVTVSQMNPPSKLLKLKAGNDGDIDFFSIDKLEEKFFKSSSFQSSMLACVAGFLQNANINLFIVMRNKAFKYYGKVLVKRMEKSFNVDFKFVYLAKNYDDIKKLLRKDLDRSQLDELGSRLKKLEKKLDDARKDKKDKKDPKKKKKKKKD